MHSANLWEDVMEKLTLAIDGMSCGHCVARVKHTLAAAPGVHVNDVSIGSASVTYDAAATSPEKIAGGERRWISGARCERRIAEIA